LKFHTGQGNYNTPVFFVRDPMKFQHFIRPRSAARTPICATTLMWVGAVMWEGTPWQVAVIHSGD
jgi:catalase